MSKTRLENQRSVARSTGALLLTLAILALLMLVLGFEPDWFLFAFSTLIPLTILGAFLLGIGWSIRLLWRSQAGNSPPAKVVGWKIFLPWGAVFSLLFYMDAGGPGGSQNWGIAIIFGLPYLLANLGFLQILGGQPFTTLPRAWAKLETWRRLSLVAFMTGSVCMFILCAYYLASLDEQIVYYNE